MRVPRRLGSLALAAACCAACAFPPRTGAEGAPASPDAGFLSVYVRPPAAAATRAKLRIEAMSLIRDDGTEVPLDVRAREIRAGSSGERRLLAKGPVPPGRYQALALRVSGAGKEGAEPAVPADSRHPLSFSVAARQGIVIEVAVEIRPGPGEEAGSEPAISAEIAAPPTFGVIGLVSSAADGVVLVLDKRNGQVGAVVPTGRGPAGLALDPDRRRAYVATSGDPGVEAIDLDQPSIAARGALQMGDDPVELELLPDRRTLVVVNRGSGTLAFVETPSLAEIGRTQVGAGPTSVAVDRLGQHAFVFNSRGATVSVVDLRSREVTETIPVDSGPVRGQFNRAQDRLWVLHEGAPYLTCIDTRALAVVSRLSLGAGATALRLDTQTDRIYVARSDGTGLDVYDPISLLPVDTLVLPGRVEYLAIDPETRLLAAALPQERRVLAVGLATRARAWTAEAGDPVFVRFVGER